MSVILWPNVIFVQISILILSGIATIILLGYTKPFTSNSANRKEIIQEIIIIFISYHIFCFSSWLPDLKMRHWIGYSIIACVLAQLFVTLLVIAIQSLHNHCISLKRRKLLRKSKRLAQNYMKYHAKPKLKNAILKRRQSRNGT